MGLSLVRWADGWLPVSLKGLSPHGRAYGEDHLAL